MKLILTLVLLVLSIGAATAKETVSPRYVGSSSCKECHLKEYQFWSDSHHSWAWRKPDIKNVLGNFNNAVYKHAGFSYRFQRDKSDFYIFADDSHGNAVKYRVHSVVGVEPLQQYLLETENGRLQTLDIAWDTNQKRWYHLYPEVDTSPESGMHWSGPYKNWNSRCAECHATGFEKKYNPLLNAYNTSQQEIGVGCEACHGPGEAHVSWADAPEKYFSDHWNDAEDKGLIRAYDKGSSASELNLCAGCHSRREAIGANSPIPGSSFNDNYTLALLRDGLYFSDGQINDEVYVYGSFLQSKMYQKGVACSHCHETHSYKLKFDSNALCTQCHNSSGHDQFPSIIKRAYDTPDHHFHKADSEGAQCKQCHMPDRNYMIVDSRRDHSFRIPRPDLTTKFGVPNTCNVCHQDKTPEWASAEISKRYPKGRLKGRHFADIFESAKKQPDELSVRQLIDLANNKQQPAIIRATAIACLFSVANKVSLIKIKQLLSDESDMIRGAAAKLIGLSPDSQKTELLIPLLNDPVKSVRLQAIGAFLDPVVLQALSSSESEAAQKVTREYQQSLIAKADFPEIQMVIGGVALSMRNIQGALSAFETAVDMDPKLIEAWIMLTRIYAATGQAEKVKDTLSNAIKRNPDSEILLKIKESQ
jgi:hypothetical protein